MDVPGSKMELRQVGVQAADEIGDRHGLAERAAETDEHGADDAAVGVGHADLAHDLPRRRAHAVAGLFRDARHHAEDVTRDGGDERQHHEREHDAGREDGDAAALELWSRAPGRGCCPAASTGPRARGVSCMNGTITKMPTMPKTMLGIAASISIPVPTTRATAGWTSSTRSRAITQRERHGDHHGDERREDRAGQRGQHSVLAVDRRPRDRREHLGPQGADRRPRVVDQDHGQAEHGHRDGDAAGRGDDPEDGVPEAQATASRRRCRGAGRRVLARPDIGSLYRSGSFPSQLRQGLTVTARRARRRR